MRRWVCIAALLAIFGAESDHERVRIRRPVPIERPIERLRARDPQGLPVTTAWFLRS